MDIYVYLYALANVFLFSDNAANFYNLANANRTQKSKEYKAAGQLVITRRWDAKTFLSTDHDTRKRHKRETYTLFQLPSLPCLPLKIGVAISFHQ